MKSLFSWVKKIFTNKSSEQARVFQHSKRKFISPHNHVISSIYYMASSASEQDETNCALWLATRAGKMEPSCPLATTRCIPQAKFHQKPYTKSFIDQVCLVKMVGYWPHSFFCKILDWDEVEVHKHTKKELGQYPAILTSHLVNNPYL